MTVTLTHLALNSIAHGPLTLAQYNAYFQPCVTRRCQLIWPMFALFRKVAAIITSISSSWWWKSLLCCVALWIRAPEVLNSSLKRLGPISHNGWVRSEQIRLSVHVSPKWQIYPGTYSHVPWVTNGPDVILLSPFVLLIACSSLKWPRIFQNFEILTLKFLCCGLEPTKDPLFSTAVQ